MYNRALTDHPSCFLHISSMKYFYCIDQDSARNIENSIKKHFNPKHCNYEELVDTIPRAVSLS